MNENIKNGKKNRGNIRNLLFVVAILLITMVFVLFSTNNLGSIINKQEKAKYSDFLSSLEKEEINSVEAMQTTANQLVIKYTLKSDAKKEFVTEAPSSEDITGVLRKAASDGRIAAYDFSKENENTMLVVLFQVLLYLGGPLLIIYFLYVRLAKMQGGNGLQHTKSRAKLQKNGLIKFDAVAGYVEEKEELQEIVDFLTNPKKYIKMGARIPKGILLSGPPGTGKTLLARATAGEAGVKFFTISGSDFLELYVGVGASRVRDMFAQAQQNAPAIIFIDEVDAIGRQRGAGVGGGNDEREQTLNQILVEMDGFEQRHAVVVMAATNRPDVLDPALLRPGRFDRQVTVSLPDIKTRIEILKLCASNKPFDKAIDFEAIARRTPGFSGAELESVCNESALLAARQNADVIYMSDVEEAIDRVMMGPAKKSKEYTAKERNLVAYHEAGHAVVGLILDDASIVQKITIIPRGQAGGYNLMTPKDEEYFSTKNQLLDRIAGLLGGRVAEELMFGDISSGAYGDIQQITAIARAMVTEYGMSELGPIQYEQRDSSVFLGRDYAKQRVFSEQTAVDIDKVVRNVVDQQHKRVLQIITDNMLLLRAIANALLEKETIVREEIEAIAEQFITLSEEKKAIHHSEAAAE